MVAEPKLDARERTDRILGPHPDVQLFVCHLPAVVRPDDRVLPVLYVHGATFPSALSIAHGLDGNARRDALCGRLRCLGIRFPRLRTLRSLSRDVRATRGASAAARTTPTSRPKPSCAQSATAA